MFTMDLPFLVNMDPPLPLTMILYKMNNYFSAKQVHLEDRCHLSSSSKVGMLATYGMDNIINTFQLESDTQNTFELNENENFTAMTLAPDGSHCLLARGSTIFSYNFEEKEVSQLCENVSLGNITGLQYGSTGHMVAVASEEGKNVILEPRSGRKEKCRPGHNRPAVTVVLSNDE